LFRKRTQRQIRSRNVFSPALGATARWRHKPLRIKLAGRVMERRAQVQVTAILTAVDAGFIAFNPETGTTTQGDTINEALANLREAVELYLEEFPMDLPAPPLVTTVTVREHA
jgi:predicted RNase H-like HicB family nuclease